MLSRLTESGCVELDQLDQLVKSAHERILSTSEIRELTRLAKQAGTNTIKEIVISFIGADSIACQNLVRAQSLRRIYATSNKRIPSKRIVGIKKHRRVIKISSHAVDRYIQRINPNATVDEAISIIEKEAKLATKSKTKSRRKKDEIWLAPSGFQIIIKRDGNGLIPVAATIIPKEDDELNCKLKI